MSRTRSFRYALFSSVSTARKRVSQSFTYTSLRFNVRDAIKEAALPPTSILQAQGISVILGLHDEKFFSISLMAQVAPGEHFDALTETEKRPTGKVVGIIRRNWRTRGYAGSLQPPKEGSTSFRTTSLFCPMEKKYPLIRIATRQVRASGPDFEHDRPQQF